MLISTCPHSGTPLGTPEKAVCIRRLASFCIFLLASFAADAQSSEYSAKVVSVSAGDIIKITVDGNSKLVLLYGIECPSSVEPYGSESKAFVSSAILGKDILVNEVEARTGLTYVEIRTMDGLIINEALLAEGLAQLDQAFSTKRQNYESLGESARRSRRGMWASLGGVHIEIQQPVKLPQKDSESLIESYTEIRELVATAQFETGYLHWVALSNTQRDLIRRQVRNNQTIVSERGASRIATRRSVLDDVRSTEERNIVERTDELTRIELDRQKEQEALRRARNDFRRDWNSSMLRAFEENVDVSEATGQSFMADVNRGLVAEYSEKVRRDNARVQRKANTISTEHKENRKEYLDNLSSLNRESRRIDQDKRSALGHLEVAGQMSRDQRLRTNAELDRLDFLDDAVRNAYRPTLSFTTVESWNGQGSMITGSFKIGSKVWVVDWDTGKDEGLGNFRFSVKTHSGGGLVKQAANVGGTHKSFLVLKSRGEFYIDAKSDSDVEWELRILEVSRKSQSEILRGEKPSSGIGLQSDTPGNTNYSDDLSELSFYDLRSALRTLSYGEPQNMLQPYIGSEIKWRGWVDRMSVLPSGNSTVHIDMDSPDVFFSVSDVTFEVDDSVASTLLRDDEIVFEGIISKLEARGSSLSVELTDVELTGAGTTLSSIPIEGIEPSRDSSYGNTKDSVAIAAVKATIKDRMNTYGTWKTAPLDGGVAVMKGRYFTYWIKDGQVYAANGLAMSASPGAPVSPASIGFFEIEALFQ